MKLSHRQESLLKQRYPSLTLKDGEYWIKEGRSNKYVFERIFVIVGFSFFAPFVWISIVLSDFALALNLSAFLGLVGIIASLVSIPSFMYRKVRLTPDVIKIELAELEEDLRSEKTTNTEPPEEDIDKDEKVYNKLLKMKELLDKGIINKQEFDKLKEKLVKKLQ